jgi:curved DNA-binding protein
MDYKDYYAILGVPKTADAKAIKSAYRKKAKQFHPDLHPEHADKFKELGEAYEVLGDEEKRQRYDMLGSQWKQGQGNPSQAQYQQWSGGGGGAGGGNINYEDLFGGASGAGYGVGSSGFSDFFEAFFGGRSQGGQAQARPNTHVRQASPKEDLDLEQGIQVTLKEVIKGGTRSFYSNALKKDVTFKIPKGISSGKKIRVQGAGKASDYERGKQGDLLLKVTIDVPSETTIDGLDITQQCKIPLVDMVLGGEHKVTLPSGDAISINIPPYSQTGQKLRIKGAGLPNLNAPEKEVGNLYLRLMPVLPKEHDEQASALYNAMKLLKTSGSTK